MNHTAALYIFFKANRFIEEMRKGGGGTEGRERKKGRERMNASENESEKVRKRKNNWKK